MKPVAPSSAKASDAAPRRRQRDEDDIDDEELSRNPRDFPFPQFQPSEAAVLRRKRDATKAIHDMVQGLKPVVPFSKPELAFARPPWCTSAVVKTSYEPQIDLLTRKDAQRTETPPLSQPKWVTYIPRAVSGCPQLGLVMVNEPDASERTPKRLRQQVHRAIADPDPVEEASKPIHIGKHKSSGATPRFGHQTKDDVTLEMLRDKRVLETVKREVTRRHKMEPSKSVLVSLPKIGVRLFAVGRRNDSPNRSHTSRPHRTADFS
jgi:hypothetical protein